MSGVGSSAAGSKCMLAIAHLEQHTVPAHWPLQHVLPSQVVWPLGQQAFCKGGTSVRRQRSSRTDVHARAREGRMHGSCSTLLLTHLLACVAGRAHLYAAAQQQRPLSGSKLLLLVLVLKALSLLAVQRCRVTQAAHLAAAEGAAARNAPRVEAGGAARAALRRTNQGGITADTLRSSNRRVGSAGMCRHARTRIESTPHAVE